MGVFTRLHRVTVGTIEAFLSRVEDPEIVFPVLVKEMEEQLAAAIEAEAKAGAMLKQCQRETARVQSQIATYSAGAAAALKHGNEELARQSLQAQIDAEKALEFGQRNLDIAQSAVEKALLSRQKVQQQLEELRTKKDEILTRARVAKIQKKIQSTVQGTIGGGDSILDAVARLQARVEQTEAELEIHAGLTGQSTDLSLDKRLAELSNEAEISRRLDELAQSLGH